MAPCKTQEVYCPEYRKNIKRFESFDSFFFSGNSKSVGVGKEKQERRRVFCFSSSANEAVVS